MAFIKNWTADELALLGTASDVDIAKRIGASLYAVTSKRQSLGIALFDGKNKFFPDKFKHLLGTDSDRAIGEKIGLPEYAVGNARRRLKIPPGGTRGRQRGSPKASTHSLTLGEIEKLGTMPDSVLAKQLGRPLHIVRDARIRTGIPAISDARRVWTPEQDEKLRTWVGTLDMLAHEVGKSKQTVVNRRRLLLSQDSAPRIPGDMPWQQASVLPQPEFIAWCLSQSRLTRRELAAAAYVSFSRIEKWAAPGTGAEPLTMAVRRLLYLTAIHAL